MTPEFSAASLSRSLLGPVAVTAVLVVLTVATTAGMLTGGGWVLAWLLLGLTAGYALSGSV